jgi:TetR/AcrR family transcriptional regulator, mexJK operon transcriptional repressor
MGAAVRTSRKRDQILEAAGEVFLDQGFGGASMDAIAAAAGVSKATVYAHFAGKEALFTEMVSDYCRQQRAAIAEIEAEHPAAQEGLERIALTIMRYLAHPRATAFSRMILGESTRFPELGRAFVESGFIGLQQEVAGFLARAAGRGELSADDPELAAELFINMIRGAVQFRSLHTGKPPSEAELRRIAAAAAALMGHK